MNDYNLVIENATIPTMDVNETIIENGIKVSHRQQEPAASLRTFQD